MAKKIVKKTMKEPTTVAALHSQVGGEPRLMIIEENTDDHCSVELIGMENRESVVFSCSTWGSAEWAKKDLELVDAAIAALVKLKERAKLLKKTSY